MTATTFEAQPDQASSTTGTVDGSSGASGTAAAPKTFDALLSSFIATFILDNDWRFYVNDSPIPAEVLARNNVLLPAIVWQAEKTHHLLCGKPMGAMFRSDPEASVGAVCVVESIPGNARSSYPIFCVEVLANALENFTMNDVNAPAGSLEVRENILMGKRLPPRGTACSLDHLVQNFILDHELGLVPWTADSKPAAPNFDGFSAAAATPTNMTGANDGPGAPNPGGVPA